MKTKKFYTIAELAGMYFIAQSTCLTAKEAHEKFPEDEFLKQNYETVRDHYLNIFKLIEKLDAMEAVIDYMSGLNKGIGDYKVEVK